MAKKRRSRFTLKEDRQLIQLAAMLTHYDGTAVPPVTGSRSN
jgi:hypothetical protein